MLDMFDIALHFESASIRMDEVINSAGLLMESMEREARDAEQIGTKSPGAALAFVSRLSLYRSAAGILISELRSISEQLTSTGDECRAESSTQQWLDERNKIADAVATGFDLPAALTAMGYDRLNEVPAERLKELLDAAQEKSKE